MPRRLQKDVAVARLQLTARDGKGGKERVAVLPTSLVEPLARQLERARALRELNLREGFGRVYLPHALARKYPNANREWRRQYVFPARHRSADSRSGRGRRHHIVGTALQKAVKRAVMAAGVAKAGRCHTFRQSFATHMNEAGLRHPHRAGVAEARQRRDDATLHAGHEQGRRGVRSPLDKE